MAKCMLDIKPILRHDIDQSSSQACLSSPAKLPQSTGIGGGGDEASRATRSCR